MSFVEAQARCGYHGDLAPVLARVCWAYDLGELLGLSAVPFGYQDCNLAVMTTSGRYFVKIFSVSRSRQDIHRYLAILGAALAAGIPHPRLHRCAESWLYEAEHDGVALRLLVFEHLAGENLFESPNPPTDAELLLIARLAARISRIDLRPEPIVDHWSCARFLVEYAERGTLLEGDDRALIAPLYQEFAQVDVAALPHGLVHGDLVRTNVIRGRDGRLFLLDFAVASHAPRVQELAVLFCDLFFVEAQAPRMRILRTRVLDCYAQEGAALTEAERAVLPLFTRVAHAMQVLGATYEAKVNGSTSRETARYLESGRRGLQCEPL